MKTKKFCIFSRQREERAQSSFEVNQWPDLMRLSVHDNTLTNLFDFSGRKLLLPEVFFRRTLRRMFVSLNWSTPLINSKHLILCLFRWTSLLKRQSIRMKEKKAFASLKKIISIRILSADFASVHQLMLKWKERCESELIDKADG